MTSRVTQSIENTGTETAYYAGWVGTTDGSVPTGTTGRNFSNGELHQSSGNRPFTSIPLPLQESAELIDDQLTPLDINEGFVNLCKQRRRC